MLARQHSMFFTEADANNDGVLDFNEFVAALPEGIRQSTPNAELERLFQVLDKDGSGSISRDEHVLWTLSAAQRMSGSGIEKILQRCAQANDRTQSPGLVHQRGTDCARTQSQDRVYQRQERSVQAGSDVEWRSFSRCADDRDGSGSLTELEFARACRDMGLGEHAEELFRSLPRNSDGTTVSYLELVEAMRQKGAAVQLDANTNQLHRFLVTLAWETTADKPEVKLDTRGWYFTAADGAGVRRGLKELMEVHHIARLSRIFEAIDNNSDHLLTRREFVRGLSETCGFYGDSRVLSAAFDEVGAGKGTIGYDELRAWLRQADASKASRMMRVQQLRLRVEAFGGGDDALRSGAPAEGAASDGAAGAAGATGAGEWDAARLRDEVVGGLHAVGWYGRPKGRAQTPGPADVRRPLLALTSPPFEPP